MAFGHRLAGVIFLFFRSNIFFLGGGANFFRSKIFVERILCPKRFHENFLKRGGEGGGQKGR